VPFRFQQDLFNEANVAGHGTSSGAVTSMAVKNASASALRSIITLLYRSDESLTGYRR